MQTREIPHGQWQSFFDDFGQRHRGMHVNVETIAEGDVKSELRDAPLVGIVAAKPKTGGEDWIEVIAGDSPDACATHAIPKPATCGWRKKGTGVRWRCRSNRPMVRRR